MNTSKLNKISFYLSLAISLFYVSIIIGGNYLVFHLPGEKILKFLAISFLSILVFSYLLLFYRFENYIIIRVNEIYNNISPTTNSIIKKATDIDLLTRNIKKINSDKNLEIEMLKSQENYRKEFIQERHVLW